MSLPLCAWGPQTSHEIWRSPAHTAMFRRARPPRRWSTAICSTLRDRRQLVQYRRERYVLRRHGVPKSRRFHHPALALVPARFVVVPRLPGTPFPTAALSNPGRSPVFCRGRTTWVAGCSGGLIRFPEADKAPQRVGPVGSSLSPFAPKRYSAVPRDPCPNALNKLPDRWGFARPGRARPSRREQPGTHPQLGCIGTPLIRTLDAGRGPVNARRPHVGASLPRTWPCRPSRRGCKFTPAFQ